MFSVSHFIINYTDSLLDGISAKHPPASYTGTKYYNIEIENKH